MQYSMWYLLCQHVPLLLPIHGNRTNNEQRKNEKERTYYICGSERATERCCSQRTVLQHGIVDATLLDLFEGGANAPNRYRGQ
jgi:hypothetical protein